jgi:hypothetical protein
MPLQLRDTFEITLPDYQENAGLAVGFAPNPSLPRVSDQQREADALAYREQINAAENLKDSFKVATAYVSAGVQATKLGKALLQYKVGLQDIRTEMVNLDRAVVRTQISATELQAETLHLNHNLATLPQLEQEYAGKLLEHKARAERAQLKAQAFIHQTAQLFPELAAQQ